MSIAPAVATVTQPPAHAPGCAGGCGIWLAANSPSCLPYPCTCKRKQRENGEPVCWYRKAGYELALDGGYRSTCDCWGAKRDGKPETCCSWHVSSPRYLPPRDPNASPFVPRIAPPVVVINLTDDDVEMIEKDTEARGADARRMGLTRDRNVKRDQGQYQLQELVGSYGEAAVHRYLGLPYTGTNGSFRQRRDAGRWGVRATNYRKGCLIYRPADGEPPDEPTILAIADPPNRTVRLVGWLWGYEVAAARRVHEPGVTEYYEADQVDLRPLVFEPGASPRLTGVDPHANRRRPQVVADESEAEQLDYFGPAVIPDIDPSLWLELPSDPEQERTPYELLWTAEERTCGCKTPFDGAKPPRGWHCAGCCSDFTSYAVGEVHRRRWTEPCRPPDTVRDIDTGFALLRQGADGVWSAAYPTAE